MQKKDGGGREGGWGRDGFLRGKTKERLKVLWLIELPL
jgi:hypothetical protein